MIIIAAQIRTVGVTKRCIAISRSETRETGGEVIVILLSVSFDQTAGNNVSEVLVGSKLLEHKENVS
jgi:hypothetical protein